MKKQIKESLTYEIAIIAVMLMVIAWGRGWTYYSLVPIGINTIISVKNYLIEKKPWRPKNMGHYSSVDTLTIGTLILMCIFKMN